MNDLFQKIRLISILCNVIINNKKCSKKRDWQINTAREVLLQYRPKDTPVLLGRQLTREDESITITTLAKLSSDDVDMFTLVSVGNSESRHIINKDKEWVYTPRGYSKKL